jgi:magnesium chelatase family protein
LEQEGEKTSAIKERVLKARNIQTKRFKGSSKKINTNSEMNVKDLGIYAPLDSETKTILNQSAERLQLSARAYHRTIKLARTIADLEGSENISSSHILEALQYRPREN